MTLVQQILYVVIAVLVTVLVRSLPFLVFHDSQRVPVFILWMGRQLPKAAMGMLVIYCLKDIWFDQGAGWIPALCAAVLTVGLHIRYRKMILSICGGTAAYMLLLRLL